MKKILAVYCILNLKTNKRYIGSTINYKLRSYYHFVHLKKNVHSSKKLQNSYNKHGIENFKIYILEQCNTKEELLDREKFYIDLFNAVDNGYNNNYDPRNPASNNIKRVNSLATKEKRRKSRLGIKHTEEAKKRMRFSHSLREERKPHSIEVRKRMSDTRKRFYKENKFEDHIKEKISKSIFELTKDKRMCFAENVPGLFMVRCLVNNKFVIYYTDKLWDRILQRTTELNNNLCTRAALQQDWNLYDSDKFEIVVLSYTNDKTDKLLFQKLFDHKNYGYKSVKTVVN